MLKKLINNSFFNKAFYNNKWLWFHMVVSGILTNALNLNYIYILIIAVIWEILEMYFQDTEKIYGNKIYFIYDAIGDVAGAVLINLIFTTNLRVV